MFDWLKKKICSHEFNVKDIKRTNIPVIKEPKKGAVWPAWERYYANIYECEGDPKRVSCVCKKCGETVYAHCAIDLKGKLRRQ